MKKLLGISGALLLTVLLAACGGGGGGAPGAATNGPPAAAAPPVVDDPATPTQTATVGIVFTDTHDSDYDEAIVTIASITLIGDGGDQEIFSGSAVVDLFRLRDFVELVTIADGVRPGVYKKIRLHLTSLVLNTLDDQGNIVEPVIAQLVANGKIDLQPGSNFEIHPGETIFISFDFDMKRSMKIVEARDGKIIVRPVIFVHIGQSPGFKDGLTRVHGEIASIDIDSIDNPADSFRMCMTDLMATPRGEDGAHIPERCLNVDIEPETGLFGSDGLPIEANFLAVGDPVTVVGRLGLGNDDGPVIQPVSAKGLAMLTSHEDADSDSDSHADSDSDSDSDGGNPPPLEFVLTAIVIEKGAPGTFASIRGAFKTGVDEKTDQYGFLVGPGQGFAPDTVLTGQMYPKTRIFSFDGEELFRADLAAEDSALVDGVIVLTDADGDSDTLRSAFLLVDSKGGSVPSPEPEEDVLVGKLQDVKPETGDMVIATDTGDRCVLAGEATVLFVVETEGSLEVINGTLGDLPDNIVVVLFGVEDIGGCFDANVVLARGGQKPQPKP